MAAFRLWNKTTLCRFAVEKNQKRPFRNTVVEHVFV